MHPHFLQNNVLISLILLQYYNEPFMYNYHRNNFANISQKDAIEVTHICVNIIDIFNHYYYVHSAQSFANC